MDRTARSITLPKNRETVFDAPNLKRPKKLKGNRKKDKCKEDNQ